MHSITCFVNVLLFFLRERRGKRGFNGFLSKIWASVSVLLVCNKVLSLTFVSYGRYETGNFWRTFNISLLCCMGIWLSHIFMPWMVIKAWHHMYVHGRELHNRTSFWPRCNGTLAFVCPHNKSYMFCCVHCECKLQYDYSVLLSISHLK